jgi:hypothetical protein
VDLVSHSTVVEACDAHGLRAQNDKLITVPEMASVLHAMYQRAAGDAPPEVAPSFNPVLNTDLALNYLLNVYDTARNGHIRVLSFKIGVTLLSRGHVDEKFRCEFAACLLSFTLWFVISSLVRLYRSSLLLSKNSDHHRHRNELSSQEMHVKITVLTWGLKW